MDLSVIILSFNTREITGRCLKHLLAAKLYCQKKFNNNIEVIVIDNNSEDGSTQMIKEDFPWVTLKALEENTGFSKGNNIGMRTVKNPYILLLNSDVYLSEDSLYKALAYFRVNLNCDVLGARLELANGKLQASAGPLPGPLNIIFWIFGLSGFHPKGHSYFKKAHPVGWVMGAFFMLKRKVLEKTGGFDEKLFMYSEEVEWSKRINDSGFKIWYVPAVSAVHLHGASSKFDYSSGFLNEIKGIKYYLKKHFSNAYLIIYFFLILGLTLRVFVFFMLGKTQRAKVYLQGLYV